MKNKKNILIAVILVLVSILSACSINDQKEIEAPEAVNEDIKLRAVATLFPQYDFARIIGGDLIEVSLLLPPGVEAHSFEPTPQDIVTLSKSDLFLYTGEGMEPWAANIVENLLEDGITVLDLSKEIPMIEAHSDHEDSDDEHEEHGMDPHYWTDPNMAIIMVNQILQSLNTLDPENSQFYEGNAEDLKQKLIKLDADIKNVVENSESKTILSGGHFAFGYFAHRYGLDHMSPYEGFSPNAEPTPQSISRLVDTIQKTGSRAIFFEELADPKVARVIVDETGVQMLLLHGVHNVSQDEINSGKGYLEIMYENLENLKIGLGYNG